MCLHTQSQGIIVICSLINTVLYLPGLEEIESMDNLHLQFDVIRDSTDNFSSANKIGQGGFGLVYMVCFAYVTKTKNLRTNLVFYCIKFVHTVEILL